MWRALAFTTTIGRDKAGGQEAILLWTWDLGPSAITCKLAIGSVISSRRLRSGAIQATPATPVRPAYQVLAVRRGAVCRSTTVPGDGKNKLSYPLTQRTR